MAIHFWRRWSLRRSFATIVLTFSFFYLGYHSSNILYSICYNQHINGAIDPGSNRAINAVSDALRNGRQNESSVWITNKTFERVQEWQNLYRQRKPRVSQEVLDKSEDEIQHRKNRRTVADALGISRDFTKLSDIDKAVTNALPHIVPLDINTFKDPVTNLYYIKVHKTGSTTLQNVIYRYGFEHNLTFALFNCENAMPFPNPALPKYFIPSTLKYFNIVSDHAVFDPYAFRSYMSEKTIVISQLRHPLSYLTSSFSFQFLDRNFGLLREQDPVAKFLQKPNEYDGKSRWRGSSSTCGPTKSPSFTKNSMAFHFGFIAQYQDEPQDISKFLTWLDKHITHVLILEKFDESLILLRRLMKWTTRDVLYLPLWSLAFHNHVNYNKRRPIEDQHALIQRHKQWAPVDYALYEFYTKKLEATLDIQNTDFWDEVSYFKDIVHKTKIFCQSMCQKSTRQRYFTLSINEARECLMENRFKFTKSQWHDDFEISFLDCVKMVLTTMDYHAASKARQIPESCDSSRPGVRYVQRTRTDKNFCYNDDRILYTFPWAFIKNKLFQTKTKCLRMVNG